MTGPMDDGAKERFSFLLAAMDHASSQFEVWELRREAETIAKAAGWTFDAALRAHRAGWPADEIEEGEREGGAETPFMASDAVACEVVSNVVIDDAADADAEADEDHLSTKGVEPATAIAAALIADPSRSDRDIAREVGCSPTTVGRARTASGLARLVRTVRRGGQSYEMAKGSRGQP